MKFKTGGQLTRTFCRQPATTCFFMSNFMRFISEYYANFERSIAQNLTNRRCLATTVTSSVTSLGRQKIKYVNIIERVAVVR